MIKDKLKSNPAQVRIDGVLFQTLKEYCLANGIKLTWATSQAVILWLETKGNKMQQMVTKTLK